MKPLIIALLLAASQLLAQTTSPIDNAFRKFWAAQTPAEAERLIGEILKTRVSFDEAWKRLKAGRTYTAQKTGVVMSRYKSVSDIEYHYAANVPANYDPGRKYQVRFQLHGGVARTIVNEPRGSGEIGALAGAEQIYVLPYSSVTTPWWGDDQVENLNTIIDRLKRTYNIDENRIVLSGVSDGGTGAYFIAMRETTRYAGVLPLNGFIMVLASPSIDDGHIYPNNLRNKPMFVINGGQDPLYPTARVEPYVRYMMDRGVDIAYYPQLEAGHNTRWWPEMKDTFEKFVSDHPRNPHPDELTWETANLTHNRAHWLVIDKLGAQRGDVSQLDDMNTTEGDTLFMRPPRVSPGRVDVWAKGNSIEAKSKGVAQFTLLLSPDKFDLSKPVTVVANGRTVFDGPVQPSVETLLKWAARDNDRTMLYAAEITIKSR